MYRAPSHAGLPSFATMLEDVPGTPAQVARHLGIKESTLKTYKRTGNAPRGVMLALFWETRWGRSAADVEASNAAATYGAQTARLTEHQARMAGAIWRLEVELDRTQAGKPANLPIWRWG